MPAWRWTIYDPVDLETYTFEINPNAGGSPSNKKNVSYTNTTAGKAIIYEGRDQVQELEWSGVILTQTHYEKYIEWWEKRRQILLTDDLGRQFWIYLKEFNPTRELSRSYPWRHSYSVIATILDW